jgi:hypothetical protein
MVRTPQRDRADLEIDDHRVLDRVQKSPESVIRERTRTAGLHGDCPVSVVKPATARAKS